MLQIQLPLQTSAYNTLISGYNNIVNTSGTLTIGSFNKIQSPFSSIVGTKNFITSASGSNVINGNSNMITGYSNIIKGDFNNLNANISQIIGLGNTIYGSTDITVNGNYNILKSTLTLGSITNVKVDGNNNDIRTNNIKVSGNLNLVEEGIIDSYIVGNSNTIQGGFFIGASGSGSASVPYSELYSSANLNVIGNSNIVGTNSNNINIQGSNNFILNDLSNIHLIGDATTCDASDRLVIAQNREVQIKSKVLPCDLIQDYTPTGLTDSYGISGYITKDEEALYVKNTTGWREIPFNNCYGNFYSTEIQTNPTASLVNIFRFNQTQQSSYINVIDNTKVKVDFNGLYNIQFSAQLEKSDSGEDDIDIWLRYNGTNVNWSNTRIHLQGNNAKQLAAWNLFQPMTASSYIELVWSSPDTNVGIYSEGTQSAPSRPGIPSIILTIDKISNI